MFLSCRPQLYRIAMVAALAAACILSACGVKGGLDPPPNAALPKGKQAPGQTQALGPNGRPIAVKPKHEPFFLDWLID